MSDKGPWGRYQSKVSEDADNIAGFFGTRRGAITAIALIGGVIVCSIIGWLSAVLP